MLGETVCYIDGPGVTLMGGVKALGAGRVYRKEERGVEGAEMRHWLLT